MHNGVSKTQGYMKRPQTSIHQDKKSQNFRLMSGNNKNKPVNNSRRPLSTNVGVGKGATTHKTDLRSDIIDFFADAKEDM